MKLNFWRRIFPGVHHQYRNGVRYLQRDMPSVLPTLSLKIPRGTSTLYERIYVRWVMWKHREDGK